MVSIVWSKVPELSTCSTCNPFGRPKPERASRAEICSALSQPLSSKRVTNTELGAVKDSTIILTNCWSAVLRTPRERLTNASSPRARQDNCLWGLPIASHVPANPAQLSGWPHAGQILVRSPHQDSRPQPSIRGLGLYPSGSISPK